MTFVIDCNIFVMCLTSRSPYHIIYRSLINGKFNLAITNDILLEYEEIIQRKYSLPTANALVALLRELPNVIFVDPSFQFQLISIDPDDNKYVDCAIASSALGIVTEDKHFNVLKAIPFPEVNVMTIDEFMLLNF